MQDAAVGHHSRRSRAPVLARHRGRAAITRFVERVIGPGGVPPTERVAVFDNDGTLWPEKPMPILADFLLRRLDEQVATDPSLVDRQPWSLALLLLHDDPEREFDYTAGADAALAEAAERGWTVVSVRDDWSRVFAD